MPPVSHVLVVSADESLRERVIEGLNAAAARLENPHGVFAIGAQSGEAALSAVLADGDIQLVLVDHGDDRSAGDGSARPKAPNRAAVSTLQRIIELRPELSLYMMLEDDDTKLLVEALASDAVDGYFFRGEEDLGGWFRILAAEVAQKSDTPFYDKLREYVALAKDSWHTPGMAEAIRSKAAPGSVISTTSSAKKCCAPICRCRCRCSIRCCTPPP